MRWQTRKGCRFENAVISHSKASPLSQNGMGGVDIAPHPPKSKISLVLNVLTLSEANGLTSRTRFYKNGKPKPEHWTEKSERHKMQKCAVFYALSPHRSSLSLPCTVRLVRIAPRELDEDDNLRIALKWIKDAVAEVITQDFVPGRADGDKRIKWKYGQEYSKEYKVKIEIWQSNDRISS